MEELLQVMRSAGEPTRLRILVVLRQIELTVSELCVVLGQSQPRVSRHLKLLCDSGLLVRHAEGTSAFYRLNPMGLGRTLVDAALELVDMDDPTLRRDALRLATVRAERAASAASYFESVAADWDRVRGLHVADLEVERAMLAGLEHKAVHDLLDIGTGTGRVLEVFSDLIDRGLGIDLSREMLNVARSRLDANGVENCTVRRGDAYDIDVETGSYDVAVLHHVLHFLDDPASAISEAARTLRPNGRLVIVDFAPHQVEQLRTDFSHRRLGFDDDEIRRWCADAGLTDIRAEHLAPDSSEAAEPLVVVIWFATQSADAPSFHTLEVA